MLRYFRCFWRTAIANRLWTAWTICAEMSFVTREKLKTAFLWGAIAGLVLVPATPSQPSSVQLWKSATSGITYKITTGAHRLEAEKIFPPKFEPQVDEGAFVRCAYSQEGDVWIGKCKSKLPFADSKNRVKWCNFKFGSRITSLSPAKIEGESEVWNSEDVDVSKCEIKKSQMQHFVWIPQS